MSCRLEGCYPYEYGILERPHFSRRRTDLKMPRKNGLEVLEWIHQSPVSDLVVMFTGSDVESDVRAAYRARVNSFVADREGVPSNKPINSS